MFTFCRMLNDVTLARAVRAVWLIWNNEADSLVN